MQKRVKFFILVSFIFSLAIVSSVSAANLFTEDFGTGTDWTTALPSGWTASDDATSGMDDQLSVTGGSDGNRYAWLKGDTVDQDVTYTGISTAGHQNIMIDYYYNLQGSFSGSDFLIVEWQLNPAGGYQTIQKVTGIPGWNQVTFTLPPAADTTIDLRFRADNTESSDTVLIDNVNINGSLIENCGNGQVENLEECDDGQSNGDALACSSTCTLTYCGDGVQQTPNGMGGSETCDDGNNIDNDNCDNNCGVVATTTTTTIPPTTTTVPPATTTTIPATTTTTIPVNLCGNGIIDPPNEECDGSNVDEQSCQTLEYDGGSLACSSCNFDTSGCFTCGDGSVDAGEQCDDNNTNPNDACTDTCQNAVCGDDIIQEGIEECDGGVGCNSSCQIEQEVCTTPLDVMLVIDRSGSMNTIDGVNTRLQNAKSSSITFLNAMDFVKDTAGLTSFNNSATLDQALTSTKASVVSAINALKAGGQTNIGDGIKVGREELVSNGGDTKVMIILSDGAPNVHPSGFCFINPTSPTACTEYAVNESELAKAAGIEIFTIGLGVNNFTEELLKQIASNESNYFFAPDSGDLESIYLQISEILCPCGDGEVGLGEECDDGNNFNYDSCTNQCENSECGDEIVEIGVEDCDDGNLNDNDRCTNNCGFTFCGDTAVQTPNGIGFGGPQNDGNEQCDDGNQDYFDVCLNNCVDNECGDGYINIGVEECDDGNLESGDGCNSICGVEQELCEAPIDTMLVIDRSGSMIDPDPQRLQDAKNAAINFINLMNFSKDAAGLTSFNNSATLDQALTSTKASVVSAINALKAGGQTNIGDGIKVGREELVANGGSIKVMIILSDGAPNVHPSGFCFINPTSPTACTEYAVNESELAKAAGIEIFTIGLGVNNFTEELLKQIASNESNYFFAPDSGDLESIYLEIAQDICPCGGQDCGASSDQCNRGFCNLETDQCEVEPRPLSTTCEVDGDLCTNDHCDGAGSCVQDDIVDCSGLNNQCQDGVCNPSDGQCYSDYSSYVLSTPCEADSNLCTNDHCDGAGSCVQESVVNCNFLNNQCQDGVCNPSDGQCYPDYSSYVLSTFCETDGNECTIQHCDGQGNCVNNPDAEIPENCTAKILKDSKVSQSMPTTNFGLGRYMMVNPKIAGTDRSYLRIDVSPLAGNVSVANLTIAVFYTGSNVVGSDIEAWYCPDHDFVETNINWNNQPLDGVCTLADTFTIPSTVTIGLPETWHTYNLLAETNDEIADGDGLFTVVLKSAEEGTVSDNSKYVQYLTKEYSEEAYRPQLEIT